MILSMGLLLIAILAILALSCISTSIFKQQKQVLGQSYVQTIKYRNLVIDLVNGLKTTAQLTYSAVGKGPFPGILLVPGAGATDMNYSEGYIRIDNKTGSKIYPPPPFFQIAQYLSERGFAVLRYDKRGVGANRTIVDSNVWKNMTYNDLVQDAQKALNVLIQQPEVNPNQISMIGHSEGGETEMKDKAYVQDLDTLSVYGQGDLLLLVFAAKEMLAELGFQNHFVHEALECQ